MTNQYVSYPVVKVSQAMFPANGDAYMYFANYIQGDDDIKCVPSLISNHKEIIRLDVLKRNDPADVLLIDGKYELPVEVPTVIRNRENLSLQQRWIQKWKNDEVTEEELKPVTIIQEMEAFIKQVYYTTDQVAKVVALWIYSTYCYSLFTDGYPTLMIQGEKGTGKTTLNTVIELLAFNPTYIVNATEAALLSSMSIYGGTHILEEMESLSNNENENDLGSILRAGYTNKGAIHRINKDTQMSVSFDVFAPKVVSSTSGFSPVLEDRGITIHTLPASEEQLKGLESPHEFRYMRKAGVHSDRRLELDSLTSRAALSALTHFQAIAKNYASINDTNTYKMGDVRLAKIIQPLLAIAMTITADRDDYLEDLLNFIENSNPNAMQIITVEALQEKIKKLFERISGNSGVADKWVADKWASLVLKKYKGVLIEDGHFKIDSIQLKLLVESMDRDEKYAFRDIHKAMKNLLGDKFKSNSKASRFTIEDTELRRMFRGATHPRGYIYYIPVDLFASK